MRNEITVGDYQTIYYKIIDASDEVREVVFLDQDEAMYAAKRCNGKVMRVTKKITQTMKFERVF
ncbi:hypothetical protein CN918_32150 [Priestia megaterium]|nr:hypothetical protein CN918_32150 [Priestia megaterium]